MSAFCRSRFRLTVAAGCAVWLCGVASSLHAAGAPPTAAPASTPSARDVLRQTIEPVVDIFARHPDAPNRAFSMHWRVAEATAQPPEFRGTRLAFICQTPDKFLFQFLALETVCTVCRQDQTIWVSPADRLAPLLKQVEEKPPTRAEREPLAPMRLTVPTKLFWVLFYLISVQDTGNATLGSLPCRRIEFHPPDSKKDEGIRLWVSGIESGKPRPARLELFGPDSRAALDVEDEQLLPSVPAESFEPDPAQRANLLNIPAERFRPFMTLLGKKEEERRKQFIHDHPAPANGGS